jgi:hypothetical protein
MRPDDDAPDALSIWLAHQREALSLRVPRAAQSDNGTQRPRSPRSVNAPPDEVRAFLLCVVTKTCATCKVVLVGAAVHHGGRVLCTVCGPMLSSAPLEDPPSHAWWQPEARAWVRHALIRSLAEEED